MSAHVIGIYRRRLAPSMLDLLLHQIEDGWTTALWALDERVPELERWTVGTGSGGKFDLLDEILERHPRVPGQDLIVTDDDIAMAPHGFSLLLETMTSAGLDFAQPAHGRDSKSSHTFNRRRRLSRARLTQFVEIGPVFAVRDPWVDRVVPFPRGFGMGWGLELVWARLSQEGCRLGVVDQVPLHHAEAPNASYSEATQPEFERLARLLGDAGFSRIGEAQVVLGTWRPWQRRPPWLADRTAAYRGPRS